MPITFKISPLAILVTASLSTFAYAGVTVNPDSHFTVSDEEFSKQSIYKKIEYLQKNSLLAQVVYDSNSATTSTYYPVDTNNNPIAENTAVTVNGLNNQNAIVYGGYCSSTSASCDIKNTNVVMSNGKVQNIHGSRSYSSSSSSAIGNVYLTSGSVEEDIYGAHSISESSSSSSYSSAIGNVYLTGGTVKNNIHGAYASSYSSPSSSAIGNVYLAGGLVKNNIYGAYASSYSSKSSSFAIGNVYLTGNAVSTNVYGAYASSYSPSKNSSYSSATGKVYLVGGSVQKNIFGAYSFASASVSATGNVYLTGGSVGGNIYGAYVSSGYSASATGNVYLYGDIKLQDDSSGTTKYNSSIWGGSAQLYSTPTKYNAFNTNRLSMGSAPLTIKTLGNFAQYDFYFNQYNAGAIKNNIALITVTDSIQNDDTLDTAGATPIKNTASFKVAGISGDGIVSKGSVVTLIDASQSGAKFLQGNDSSTPVSDISVLFNTKDGDKETGVNVGLVGKADITYGVDTTNNKLTATIDDYRIDKGQVNLNVKPLAEGRLAGLQNTVRGADMLLDVMGGNEAVGSFTPIAAISGGVNKYKSGSHIDSRDYRLVIGSRYQIIDSLYTGLAVEYGRSNYDTYNTGDIHGKGHTYNYGVSLFTKYSDIVELGEVYLDGAFRVGRTDTTFDSNDIVTGSGDTANYKSKVNYLGAHIGSGFIYAVDQLNSFDTSVRYLWTRLGSDSVVLDGNKVNFDKSTSSRVQLKEQYNRQTTANLTFSLAGIYEYEFDGKADANVSGIGINAPSVKGSTGIMELGIKGTPIADNKNLSFNLSFKGYGGKRQGASASAFLQYNF